MVEVVVVAVVAAEAVAAEAAEAAAAEAAVEAAASDAVLLRRKFSTPLCLSGSFRPLVLDLRSY